MRKIIMLRPETAKMSSGRIKERIGDVVALFDAYLDEYPIKSSRSKHALMGPVAKVLERAKAGQWDIEPLTGYALRIHEMNSNTQGGFVSMKAIQNLRAGTEALLQLCRDIPVTALATTIEQIDYSLYFQRRKQGIEWLEAQSQALRQILKEKYKTNEDLRNAWALKKSDNLTVDTVRYFGKRNPRYRDGNSILKADMDAFYQQMREQNQNPEAIEEEEDN